MEKIGLAIKYSDTPPDMEGGVQFDVPYGENSYRIGLKDAEMDKLLDKTYATEVLGRGSIIGSGFVIELERHDLPLFALPHSLHIEKEAGRSPAISLGVLIVTMSHVYEHGGVLLADRCANDTWELRDYAIQPPLRDIEEVFAAR